MFRIIIVTILLYLNISKNIQAQQKFTPYHTFEFATSFGYQDQVNMMPFSPSLGFAYPTPQNLSNGYARFDINIEFGANATIPIKAYEFGLEFGMQLKGKGKLYVADGDFSRPLHSDLGPKVFVLAKPIKKQSIQIGVIYDHASNGKVNVRSRGWDRLLGVLNYEKNKFKAYTMVTFCVIDAADNPDIIDEYGRGEALIQFNPSPKHQIMVNGITNFKNWRGGSIRSHYTYQISNKIFLKTQLSYGKGIYLIDYNFKQFEGTIGILFKDTEKYNLKKRANKGFKFYNSPLKMK